MILSGRTDPYEQLGLVLEIIKQAWQRSTYQLILLEACSSSFAAPVEFDVARSATMDSAVASSSVLGLVFTAMLALEAMVLSAVPCRRGHYASPAEAATVSSPWCKQGRPQQRCTARRGSPGVVR